MKKVRDIFSYVSEKELSLEFIEQSFNDLTNNGKESSLEFLFEKQIEREDMQGAINELIKENKEVAIVKMNGKAVAILGYIIE